VGGPTWPLTEDLTGQHGGTLPLCIRQDALCVAVVDQVIDGNDELTALARMRPHRVVSTADTGRRPSERFQPLFESRPLHTHTVQHLLYVSTKLSAQACATQLGAQASRAAPDRPEVGYLHPPVGLNLFITSVKFQRPITEVMWATVPFLLTMIVALLTITYVPAFTEVSASMSPYDPARSGRVQDLSNLVHVASEALSVVREVALVDATGAPLHDATGKPITKRIDDCNAIKDELTRSGCQQVFFDVKACRGKPDEAVCTHQAIAHWVVKNLNATDDPALQIIVVTEVPLVTADGAPIKTKAGAPIVKKLSDCAGSTDNDSCRELFLNVSNCKISPPDGRTADACVTDAIATWVDANQSELEAH
jgi:hypothetical protein